MGSPDWSFPSLPFSFDFRVLSFSFDLLNPFADFPDLRAVCWGMMSGRFWISLPNWGMSSEMPGPVIMVKSDDDILLDGRIPLNMILECVRGRSCRGWFRMQARLEQRVLITCSMQELLRFHPDQEICKIHLALPHSPNPKSQWKVDLWDLLPTYTNLVFVHFYIVVDYGNFCIKPYILKYISHRSP